MSEPTDRPLHVQVAKALGCRPKHLTHYRNGTPVSHPYWTCTCPSEIHNSEGQDGAPHEGVSLEDYTTDWSATGPLIDRLLSGPRTSQLILHSWKGVADRQDDFQAYLGGQGPEGWGKTPLEAVCRLIVALAAATPTGKLELELKQRGAQS